MPFKIAIIGAGPAGCTLARLLQHRQDHSSNHKPISVTIFEAESHLDVRSQGGTLDLHEKTGQAALAAAGLFEQFQQNSRHEGESMKIADKNLLCYVKQTGSKTKSTTGRPEIDRPVLRQILYDSLAEGTVQWGKKVLGVHPAKGDGEKHKLLFANPSASEQDEYFDLIIGADGAFSKIRPTLSSVQPFYSGIGGYSMMIPCAQTSHPQLWSLTDAGNVFAFSDGKSIMAQAMGDRSINVGTWGVRDENWRAKKQGFEEEGGGGGGDDDVEGLRKAMREEYEDWDPRLVEFTQKVEKREEVVARNLYMLPVGHRWEHVPGVTLIGDAAHVMTPFAGEGVNLAMQDAMKLAEGILGAAAAAGTATTEEDAVLLLDRNVKAFEEDMFVRATKTQQLTVDMMEAMFFTPGAPRNGIERYLIRAVEDELGPLLTALVKPLVYCWFFIFKLIW